MFSGADVRPRPSTTAPTVAAELEEIVSGMSGVMTVYPAHPRWAVDHFADDRILMAEKESGSVITIHIGITATSSARVVSRDVWETVVGHLTRSGAMPLSAVEVKVCSIG